MKRSILALALILGTAAGSAAWAQEFKITAEQAVEIARERGIVKITEVERDGGRWEIEGRDKDGREIEIEVDGQTGEVVKFERD